MSLGVGEVVVLGGLGVGPVVKLHDDEALSRLWGPGKRGLGGLPLLQS